MEVSVMLNSKLFWFVAGAGAFWAWHAFVKPAPTNKGN